MLAKIWRLESEGCGPGTHDGHSVTDRMELLKRLKVELACDLATPPLGKTQRPDLEERVLC